MNTTIRVIDYETTGTPEDQNPEIIEMGSYDLIQTKTKYWSIIRPSHQMVRPSSIIPPQARAVHHISDAEVAKAPTLREVIDDFLEGSPTCAAHNAQFEAYFTPYNLSWICTYKCARAVWPDAPGYSNQCLRYWLEIDQDKDFVAEQSMPPHRALPDAYITAHILRRLLAKRSIKELITISKYPALLKVMNFGKYKGTAFADAPTDYLEWIKNKSEFDADTKFSAKYWLQKRMQK
ncbi:MAG: DUF3820 family protein [Rhodobacteraceae bacterium]|jgi:exodeoxyribonuclease X|nr:DUF3820 family protein [Paracoccaceae bacterium]